MCNGVGDGDVLVVGARSGGDSGCGGMDACGCGGDDDWTPSLTFREDSFLFTNDG